MDGHNTRMAYTVDDMGALDLDIHTLEGRVVTSLNEAGGLMPTHF